MITNLCTDYRGQTEPGKAEEWRSVPDFPGYEVSSRGRVRSFCGSGKVDYSKPPRILKPSLNRQGYECVGLRRNKKQFSRSVHSLVALAFLGERPYGYFVCHNDGSRTNNVLSNLRYDTPASNRADMKKHGTHIEGEQCYCALLTNAQAKEVRLLHSNGRALPDLASRYDVNVDVIRSIVKGHTYRSAGGPVIDDQKIPEALLDCHLFS